MRLTKGVFSGLAIWMVLLSIFFGAMFPFFVAWMEVPVEHVLAWPFFGASMLGGFVIGAANWVLVRHVVAPRVTVRRERMASIEEGLKALARGGDVDEGVLETWLVEIDSNDEFGEGARAFNNLVRALFTSLRSEASVRAFTGTLTARLDLDELTGPALRQLLHDTGADAGALLVEEEGELRMLASFGLVNTERLLVSDHVRRAVREQVAHRIETPDDVRLDGVISEVHPNEVLVQPITHNSAPVGVAVLAATCVFTREACARVELYMQGMGLALNNALAHDRLQRLVAVDPLTSAYNRRFGLARLREEFGRSRRSGTPLGLLMIDVDHFKPVNDTYGHLVGDRVLVGIVRAIRPILREGDALMRFGGEEFLAILPAAAKDDVASIGARMRRTVEEIVIPEGDQQIRVTISLGGVSYPDTDVPNEDVLIVSADQAMYRAKQEGRNRVVV